MPYIEFIGAPGSGKTTRAKALLESDGRYGAGRRSLTSKGQRSPRLISRLGLPALNASSTLRLMAGFPADLLAAARFLLACGGPAGKRLRRTSTMLALLVKARALNGDPGLWIVDQGLYQHLLSCHAAGQLDRQGAEGFATYLANGARAPAHLVVIEEDEATVVSRVQNSAKHMRQCGTMKPSEYVGLYTAATRVVAAAAARAGVPSGSQPPR